MSSLRVKDCINVYVVSLKDVTISNRRLLRSYVYLKKHESFYKYKSYFIWKLSKTPKKKCMKLSFMMCSPSFTIRYSRYILLNTQ